MKFTTGFYWPNNLPINWASVSTFALNGTLSGGYSQNWYAGIWVPLHNGTVSKIRVYASAVTGTLSAGNLVCDIYSVSAGVPNASLQSSSTVTSVPTTASWVEFTGFTQAVTPGTPYAIVIRNANGTPASNSITLRYLSASGSQVLQAIAGSPPMGQCYVLTSTNSGGAWTLQGGIPFFVVDYGSSTLEGFSCQAVAASTATVYASREVGVYFTIPDQDVNVAGIVAAVVKSGTPTGNLRYRIYTGAGASPTLVGTTGTAVPADVATGQNGCRPLWFSSPVTLTAGSVVRVVVSETTQSDAASNNYTINELTITSENVWYPLSGPPKRTLSTDGGATFSETADRIPQIALLLDAEDPFPEPAASGGLLVHPGMAGGMRG